MKYFGTDGIRGRANQGHMTPDSAMATALAAGLEIKKNLSHQPRVVIGKDTRLSGYMLEPALTAGFVSAGFDVSLLGPLPSPGVAMLTRSLRADLGVVISASHNPFWDNGIKLFGPDGYKLDDDLTLAIEERLSHILEKGFGACVEERAVSEKLGRVVRLQDSVGRYVEFVKRTIPRRSRLDGLKVVVDCANGAAYKAAPAVLYELGAEVVPLFVSPSGLNINEACGATDTKALSEAVLKEKADLGIALDGDADRLILVDEKGQELDGDQIIASIATSLQQEGRLPENKVVTTIMSNLGLERYLETLGIDLVRTQVGDRFVMAAMKEQGIQLGGEQSGHIILREFTTTGDGLIAALQACGELINTGKKASETLRLFTPLPQKLVNLVYQPERGNPLDLPVAQKAIQEAETALKDKGRLVIRKSGTEPKIRLMAEAETHAQIDSVLNALEKSLSALL